MSSRVTFIWGARAQLHCFSVDLLLSEEEAIVFVLLLALFWIFVVCSCFFLLFLSGAGPWLAVGHGHPGWPYVAFVLEYDVGSAAALVCMYVSTGSCMT